MYFMVWPINFDSPSSSALMIRALWVTVLTLGIGSVSWSGYQDWLTGSTTEAIASQSVPVSVSTRQVSISALVSAHLFGQPQQRSAAEPIETTNAPETRLRLQLRGVFAHSDPALSRVLISAQGKSAEYYRLGDSLSGGATLEAVAAEHVVLNRDGQLETLSFKTNKSALGNPQLATRNIPGEKKSSSSIDPTVDSTKKLASTQQRTESIKDRLKRLREARDL